MAALAALLAALAIGAFHVHPDAAIDDHCAVCASAHLGVELTCDVPGAAAPEASGRTVDVTAPALLDASRLAAPARAPPATT